MFCKNCGNKLQDNAAFCPSCGQKTQSAQNPAQPAAPVNTSATPMTQTQAVPAQQAVPLQYATTEMHQPQIQNPYQHQHTYTPQPNQYASPPVGKVKKKHGCLTALFVVLGIIIAAAVAVYILVPGLLRPYDLAVKSSPEAYQSALAKLQMSKDIAPTEGEADDYVVVYGPYQSVSTALTSEEVTSFFNENRPDYFAVKNVQVRINEDGSIEASANIDVNYIFNKILNGQYTREDAQSALPMLGLLPNNVNFYFKVYGGVVDNQVQGLYIDEVSVMGITIPENLVSSQTAMSFVTTTLNGYIARTNAESGASYDLIQVNGGSLDFVGDIPSSVSRIPVQ